MNKESKKEKREKKTKIQLEKEKERLRKLEEKGKKKAKGFIHDFKEFATKGNVIDMAVGVAIATSFTKIVNSLVNDVITPALSIFVGKLDFSNLYIALDGKLYASADAAKEAGIAVINYGIFITNIVNFITIALALFIFLKVLFKFKRNKQPAQVVTPTTKKCPYCLNDIPLEATRCGHCTSILEET